MHDNTGIPCPIEVHFLQKWNPAFEYVCVCYFDGKIDGLNSSFSTPPRQPIYYKHLCLGTLPAPQ